MTLTFPAGTVMGVPDDARPPTEGTDLVLLCPGTDGHDPNHGPAGDWCLVCRGYAK